MTITHSDVERFRKIWEKEFQEKISEEEARKQIQKLDEFYLFLYKSPQPIKRPH